MIVVCVWVLKVFKFGFDGVDKGYYNYFCEVLCDFWFYGDEGVLELVVRINVFFQCVLYLNECVYRMFLQYLFGMSVWIYSFEVVDVFLVFVVNLLIVNGCFVFDCFDMLVCNFLLFFCGFLLFFDLFS